MLTRQTCATLPARTALSTQTPSKGQRFQSTQLSPLIYLFASPHRMTLVTITARHRPLLVAPVATHT